MSENDEPIRSADRYRTLGMIANPFVAQDESELSIGMALEVQAGANELLRVLDAAAAEERPRPIWVNKPPQVPPYFGLRAISNAESSLANDDSLNVLHAYLQLYMMRTGRVRSILGVVAERLAFRSFDRTLEPYVRATLAEPDTELASYQVLGPEGLEEFKQEFEADATAALEACFGPLELERQPELAEVADIRLVGLEENVEEADDTPEIDTTVGNPPGLGSTPSVLAAAADSIDSEEPSGDQEPEPRDFSGVLDYFIEYTKVHLSPVVARGLRVYKERGFAAMAAEFKITKAPRKTLAALVRFARCRFREVAIIYDDFEGWLQIEPELRSEIVGTLSNLRWMLDGQAVLVFLSNNEEAPELAEQFGSGAHVEWAFSGLRTMEESPDGIDPSVVNGWLAAAAMAGDEPQTVDSPWVRTLLGEAEGSLERFVRMAAAAIESAAERKLAEVDDLALEAARSGLEGPE